MSPRCDLLIVMGVTDPDAERHRRQSMILVDPDTPGVDIRRSMHVLGYLDGPHGGHAEIDYDGVRVPTSSLLGGEGEGFAIAQARLGPGRIHHAMRAIGLAERALSMMVQRVTGTRRLRQAADRPGRDPPVDRRRPDGDRAGPSAGAEDRLADGHGRQQGRADRDLGDQGGQPPSSPRGSSTTPSRRSAPPASPRTSSSPS